MNSWLKSAPVVASAPGNKRRMVDQSSGSRDEKESKLLELVRLQSLITVDDTITLRACVLREWMVSVKDPMVEAMLSAGTHYTKVRNGKKPAEHNQGTSDLHKFGALVTEAIKVADSEKHINGKSHKEVLQLLFDETKSPLDLQGRVLCCALKKAHKSDLKRLMIKVEHDLEDVAVVIEAVLLAKGFPRYFGKDSRGSLAKDIEKLRKELYKS